MSWIDELKVGDKVIVDIYNDGDMILSSISRITAENGKLKSACLSSDICNYNYPRIVVEKTFFKHTEENILRGIRLKRYLKLNRWLESIELDDTVLIDALYAVMEKSKC